MCVFSVRADRKKSIAALGMTKEKYVNVLTAGFNTNTIFSVYFFPFVVFPHKSTILAVPLTLQANQYLYGNIHRRKSCVSAYSWYWLKPVHRCTLGICCRGLKEIGDHYLTNFNDPIRFLIWNSLFKRSMMFVNTFLESVCPREDYNLYFCFTVKYYLQKNISQSNISKRKYSGDCMGCD